MVLKIIFHILIMMMMQKRTIGGAIPDSIKELQHYFGDGTANDVSNVFYKVLQDDQDMQSEAEEQLRQHLNVSDWYGFHDAHVQTFVDNMKLISETKLENDQDLKVLRSRLYEPDDFQASLLMDSLLNNRDDAEEASIAFDKVYIKLDNSVVQLYYTSDEDIFSGVVVAAKRKNTPCAVYLVFVVD